MTHTNALGSPPTLVAVPVYTSGGVRHVTGQTIDEAGLLAVHPELTEHGFTGQWVITNVLTGASVELRPGSSAWPDHPRALAGSGR